MKNKAFILLLLAVLAFAADLSAAEKWMTRVPFQVTDTGFVETVILPELHRACAGFPAGIGLDLSLAGPDGNPRAFELFWKSAGASQSIQLVADKVTLLDDHRIFWEASLTPGYNYNSLKLTLAGANYTGKVDFDGMIGGQWVRLATGTLLTPGNVDSKVAIAFTEAPYEKIRCYFTGFDKYFKQAPVFVKFAEVMGGKPGSDFARSVLTPQVEQVSIEDGVEARIFLPGSGLRIETIEVFTSAQFKGAWQLGRENIHLGKRDFFPVRRGETAAVGDELKKLVISFPEIWNQRTMLIRLKSNDFFGKIEKVRFNVILPRMLFVADQAGEYALQTGLARSVSVMNNPATANISSTRDL